MKVAEPQFSLDDHARMGHEAFTQRIQPTLRPEDDGKYVAIDIVTGDFEIDADDYRAGEKLRRRIPEAQIWLERAGCATAYRFGLRSVGDGGMTDDQSVDPSLTTGWSFFSDDGR